MLNKRLKNQEFTIFVRLFYLRAMLLNNECNKWNEWTKQDNERKRSANESKSTDMNMLHVFAKPVWLDERWRSLISNNRICFVGSIRCWNKWLIWGRKTMSLLLPTKLIVIGCQTQCYWPSNSMLLKRGYNSLIDRWIKLWQTRWWERNGKKNIPAIPKDYRETPQWALTDSNRRPSACKADALNQLS